MSERVAKYMAELNEELWMLGVTAKTQHYEVAPAQYELAPVYATANIATDHNQLVMEMMRKVADRHGFVCFLHEKPFNWVNGSGKHNNWSLITNTGVNLLKPGKDERENEVFLTFLVATIAAVDEYAEALRFSCATLGNECRLGGNEAPPCIISVYVGQQICEMLDHIEAGDGGGLRRKEKMNIGVSTLPILLRDESDRNRTSPFAFTGNKFEFRMVGSSQSLGLPNTVLNTIVAEELSRISRKLEEMEGDVHSNLKAVLAQMVREHRRILFNGNNYSEEWRVEAEKRGLPAINSTVEAVEHMTDGRIVDVFSRHGVLSEVELTARKEIGLRSYVKHAMIEAVTMLKVSRQKLLPACVKYSGALANAAAAVEGVGCDAGPHRVMLETLCSAISDFQEAIGTLALAYEGVQNMGKDNLARARAVQEFILPRMSALRACADKLEIMVDKEFWPLPSYGEMMFNLN